MKKLFFSVLVANFLFVNPKKFKINITFGLEKFILDFLKTLYSGLTTIYFFKKKQNRINKIRDFCTKFTIKHLKKISISFLKLVQKRLGHISDLNYLEYLFKFVKASKLSQTWTGKMKAKIRKSKVLQGLNLFKNSKKKLQISIKLKKFK